MHIFTEPTQGQFSLVVAMSVNLCVCVPNNHLSITPQTVNTLCFDGRKYDPFLINIVKSVAAGDDCLIHQTYPIPKFEQQTCRVR